jgi:hypothetical protein
MVMMGTGMVGVQGVMAMMGMVGIQGVMAMVGIVGLMGVMVNGHGGHWHGGCAGRDGFGGRVGRDRHCGFDRGGGHGGHGVMTSGCVG